MNENIKTLKATLNNLIDLLGTDDDEKLYSAKLVFGINDKAVQVIMCPETFELMNYALDTLWGLEEDYGNIEA